MGEVQPRKSWAAGYDRRMGRADYSRAQLESECEALKYTADITNALRSIEEIAPLAARAEAAIINAGGSPELTLHMLGWLDNAGGAYGRRLARSVEDEKTEAPRQASQIQHTHQRAWSEVRDR